MSVRKDKHKAVMQHLTSAKAEPPARTGSGLSGVPPIAMATGLRSAQIAAAETTIRQLREELEQVKAQGGEVLLDPARIVHGRFRDRHELGFSDAAFQELKRSIQQRNGNVQPILVRPLPAGGAAEYEVVWGHRRHRACAELGIQVRAVVRPLEDREAVLAMAVENENREDLSFYEIARKYGLWLQEGLFESMNQIAQVVGLNRSTVSRVVAISKLPESVVKTLADPRAIGPTWAVRVNKLVEEEPARLDRLKGQSGLTPAQVLQALEGPDQAGPQGRYDIGGNKTMQVHPRGGGVQLRIPRLLSEAQVAEIAKLIASWS